MGAAVVATPGVEPFPGIGPFVGGEGNVLGVGGFVKARERKATKLN